MSAYTAVTAAIHRRMGVALRGMVGMACLIVAESAIFIIFVVAYIFYLGKSLSGPTPAEVLEAADLQQRSACLSSSLTVHFAVDCFAESNAARLCSLWLAADGVAGRHLSRRHRAGVVRADLPTTA